MVEETYEVRMRQMIAMMLHRIGFGAYRFRSDFSEIIFQFLRETNPPEMTHKLTRFGPSQDGGYFVPELSKNFDYLFSPGVGNQAEFDLEFANKGIPVYQLDGTIGQAPVSHKNIVFWNKNLSSISTEMSLSLDDWVNLCAPKMHFGILQLDIEGGEYEAFLACSNETMRRFSCMVVEFHSLERLSAPILGDAIINTVRKILQTHLVVYRNVNNNGRWFKYQGKEIPSTVEITFLRKDLFQPSIKVEEIPHLANTSKRLNRQLGAKG